MVISQMLREGRLSTALVRPAVTCTATCADVRPAVASVSTNALEGGCTVTWPVSQSGPLEPVNPATGRPGLAVGDQRRRCTRSDQRGSDAGGDTMQS